jgi:NIPSNAP
MQRRDFLTASLATSAFALTPHLSAQSPATQTPASHSRDYYLVRRYALQSGPQTSLTEHYFGEALFPALTRLGLGPSGAFRVEIGPETPVFYLLIPGSSVDTLANLDLRLAQDSEFLKAAAPFWSTPATAPAFQRIDSSLLIAFEGWPKLTPPASAAAKGKRILQLRTYESATHQDHVRKVEMFHSGEFEIFKNAGFHPVFFGDTLIGQRMPSLTYMLSFADSEELNAKWDVFRNDANWKKLSADPHFAFEAIVSNITNLVLSPLSVSAI